MRKLIENIRQTLIVCDNPKCKPKCKFEIPYSQKGDDLLILFVDRPCPQCGTNLLTAADYLQEQNLLKNIAWINKWFSWLLIFTRKPKYHDISVHVHEGIKITKV